MQTGGEPQHHGKGPALSEASPWDSSLRRLAGFDSMPHHQKRQGLLDAACPASSEASPWDASSKLLGGLNVTSHHQKRQQRKESSGKSIQTQKVKQNSKHSVTAQLRAMEALAKERNINMSDPENAKLMTQLFPRVQSRRLAQGKANKKNKGALSLSALLPMPVSSSQFAEGSSGPNPPKAREIMVSHDAMFPKHSQPESVYLNLDLGNPSNNNIKSTLSGSGALHQLNPLRLNYSSLLSDGAHISPQGSAYLPISNSSEFGEIMMSNNAMFPMQVQEESPSLSQLLQNISNYNMNSTLSGSGTGQMLNTWQPNHSTMQSDDGRPMFLLGDVAADAPKTRIGFLNNQFEMGERLSHQILQDISPPPLDRLPSQPAGTSNLDIGTRRPNSQPDPWEWYF